MIGSLPKKRDRIPVQRLGPVTSDFANLVIKILLIV
jgi:hypothetical protein